VSAACLVLLELHQDWFKHWGWGHAVLLKGLSFLLLVHDPCMITCRDSTVTLVGLC